MQRAKWTGKLSLILVWFCYVWPVCFQAKTVTNNTITIHMQKTIKNMIYTLVYSILNILYSNIFSIPFEVFCCCSCGGILCARKNTLSYRVVYNITFQVINYGFVHLFILVSFCESVCVCVLRVWARLCCCRLGIIAVVNFVDKQNDWWKSKLHEKQKQIQSILLIVCLYSILLCFCVYLFFGCFVHQFNCTIFRNNNFQFSSFTCNTHSKCFSDILCCCCCHNSTKPMWNVVWAA